MLYTVVLLKNVSGLLSLKCSFCSKSNIKKQKHNKKNHNIHGVEMRFLSQSPARMFVNVKPGQTVDRTDQILDICPLCPTLPAQLVYLNFLELSLHFPGSRSLLTVFPSHRMPFLNISTCLNPTLTLTQLKMASSSQLLRQIQAKKDPRSNSLLALIEH